jgi:dihydropyrimidine dehydrogenase (NADP+)
MGYTNLTIFEKEAFPGGLSSTEIPQFRLPYDVVEFELSLLKDLGVHLQYNTTFGKDITFDSLQKDGYEAIFLGIGLPSVRMHPAATPRVHVGAPCGTALFLSLRRGGRLTLDGGISMHLCSPRRWRCSKA